MKMEHRAEMNPDAKVIKDFISQITEDWNEVGQPLLEIRSIGPTGSTNPSRFKYDAMDEIVQHCVAMNAAKQNIYMCINPVDPITPIPAGKGAKDEDILAAFYCFADADDEAGMSNILNFVGPQFTMSVKTGTTPAVRGHAYWKLEEPCKNMDAWKDVQKAIASRLQTDPAVINPSRIMRVAGTISWPNDKKKAKGYVPELVTMRTEFSTDRDPVPFERIMSVFSSAQTQKQGTNFEIDLGKEAMDRQLAIEKIEAGDNWHTNLVRLVGSYVSRGLSDTEIHAITDGFTLSGYSVDDTRIEVQKMIDGARDKGWTPAPDPMVQKMERQTQHLEIATEPTEAASGADDAPTWPTPYNSFNAMAIEPRRWVYGYDYIKKYVSVTASAGGIGKTSLTIVEALAIVTGKPLFDVSVKEQCNVWLINLEDPRSELEMRTIAAMEHYEIKPEEVRGRLFMDGEDDIGEMTLAAETREGVQQNDALLNYMIQKVKENDIGVVILDPFVSAHLVNENNNGSIQAVVAMLRKLAREGNASVQLVHHIRKTNGEDAGIDSVRGAVSLIGAARAARVINRVSKDKLISLGVEEGDATGIFRIDDGKANLAPPSEKAVYRKMVSYKLANEEYVGVATKFKMPSVFAGITGEQTRQLQQKIREYEEKEGKRYRHNKTADDWFGYVVAEELKIDINKQKDRVSQMIEGWIDSKVLVKISEKDKSQGRNTPYIALGEEINRSEV